MCPAVRPSLSRPRRGFSLIEAAIVLGVIGLVIGGIWVASAGVRQQSAINRSVSAVIDIVNNTKSLIGGSPASFCQQIGCVANVNVTAPLFAAGVVPGDFTLSTSSVMAGFGFWSTNDVLKTPMGVDMFVTAGDWGVYGSIFGLKIVPVFINTDRDVCMKLIAAISSRFKDNSQLEWVESSAGQTSSFPVPVTSIPALCRPLSMGNNYLMFYFNAY